MYIVNTHTHINITYNTFYRTLTSMNNNNNYYYDVTIFTIKSSARLLRASMDPTDYKSTRAAEVGARAFVEVMTGRYT